MKGTAKYFESPDRALAAAPTDAPYSVVDITSKSHWRRPIRQSDPLAALPQGQPRPNRPQAWPQAAGRTSGASVPFRAVAANVGLKGHGELTCTARLGKLKRRNHGGFCVNGHEKTDENTYRGKKGDLQCRICRRENERRRAAKHRLARNAARRDYYYRHHDRIRATVNEQRRAKKRDPGRYRRTGIGESPRIPAV